MTDSHEKHEVVRYVNKTPKGWVTRGMLLRVVARTSKGKLRVSAANGKNPGGLQYIEESDVEPVGHFADSSKLFGTNQDPELEQVGQVSQDEADKMLKDIASPSIDMAPPWAKEPEPEPAPSLDVRGIVHAEVERALREVISEMVRDEISALIGH